MTDPGQSPSPAIPAAPELQFDRLEPTSDRTPDTAAPNTEGIVCSGCNSVMFDEYYSIGGKPICASCRASVETTRATSRTPKAFLKALAFALGAALAGAAVYYAVMEFLDLEIGIVAILIGWLVGRAIQKALPGGGLRRYQVLAAVLTYFAVGIAYMPLVMAEMKKDKATAKAQDSTAVVTTQATQAPASSAATKGGNDTANQKNVRSLLLGVGALIALAFALPVIAIFSGGAGILSALIIGIGMRQAWRMSGAPALAITGPFRVGGNTVAASAS